MGKAEPLTAQQRKDFRKEADKVHNAQARQSPEQRSAVAKKYAKRSTNN